MPPHHICDFAGVLALESCYLDLLRQRPADEVTRIAQIMGRFAHEAGAGVRGAQTPATRPAPLPSSVEQQELNKKMLFSQCVYTRRQDKGDIAFPAEARSDFPS